MKPIRFFHEICKLFSHRFTEELFATLIAFIFIFNAFHNLTEIGRCHCEFSNETFKTTMDFHENFTTTDCQDQGERAKLVKIAQFFSSRHFSHVTFIFRLDAITSLRPF